MLMPKIFDKSFLFALLLSSSVIALTPAAGFAASNEQSQRYYDSALKNYEDNRLREAAIELKNALKSDPNNAEARLLKGKINEEIGDITGAEKEYRRAHDLAPTGETELSLGRVLNDLGRHDEVLGVVRSGVVDSHEAEQRLLMRAEAHIALDEIDKARNEVEQVLAAHPYSADAQYSLARVFAAEGNGPSARRALDHLLAQHADYPDAWMMRAEMSLADGDRHGANRAFEKAIALQPRNMFAYLGRARAALAAGDLEQAESDVQRMEEITPGAPATRYLKAAILFHSGETAAAKTEFATVKTMLRNFPPAVMLSSLIDIANGDFAQAETQLRRYLQLRPGQPAASEALAKLHLRQDRASGAERVLKKQLRSTPGHLKTLKTLAGIYLAGDKFEQARGVYREIANSSSETAQEIARVSLSLLDNSLPESGLTNREARQVLKGLELLEIGLVKEAVAAMVDIDAMKSNSPIILNVAGRAAQAAGDDATARRAFERSLEVDPEYLAPLEHLEALDRGDVAKSDARLAFLSTSNPEAVEIQRRLASRLVDQGQPEEAIRVLESALQSNEDHPELLSALYSSHVRASNFDSAANVAERMLEAAGDQDRVVAFAYSALRDIGRYGSAEKAARALIKLQPDNVSAYQGLADMLMIQNKDQEAAQVMLDVARKWPGNPEVTRQRISHAMQLGDVEHALKIAAELKNTDATLSARFRADILSQTGRNDEAVALVEANFKGETTDEMIKIFSILNAAGKSDAAFERMENWVAQNEHDQRALMVLATGYIAEGQMERAEDIYGRALALMPNNPIALNNYAWARHELKRHDALDYARRAFELAPGSAEIADTYGWMLVSEGKLKNGLLVLRAAAQNAPDNADILYHYAYALAKSGQKDEARDLIIQVLDNFDEFDRKVEAEALRARL